MIKCNYKAQNLQTCWKIDIEDNIFKTFSVSTYTLCLIGLDSLESTIAAPGLASISNNTNPHHSPIGCKSIISGIFREPQSKFLTYHTLAPTFNCTKASLTHRNILCIVFHDPNMYTTKYLIAFGGDTLSRTIYVRRPAVLLVCMSIIMRRHLFSTSLVLYNAHSTTQHVSSHDYGQDSPLRRIVEWIRVHTI